MDVTLILGILSGIAAIITIAEVIRRRVLRRETRPPKLLFPSVLKGIGAHDLPDQIDLNDILLDTNVVVGANVQARGEDGPYMTRRGDEDYTERLIADFRKRHPGHSIDIRPEGWEADAYLATRHMVVVGAPRSNLTCMKMNKNLPIVFGAVTHPRMAATRALIPRKDSKVLRIGTQQFGRFHTATGDAVIEVVRNPLDKSKSTLAVVVMGLYGEGTKGALYALFNDELREVVNQRMSGRLVKCVFLEAQLGQEAYVDIEGEKVQVPLDALRYP